jgi:L-fucose mutarotase
LIFFGQYTIIDINDVNQFENEVNNMLKGIPRIISPALLKVLAEMGHGDKIVIADGNFPSESVGKDAIVIRCDGHGVPELLDAILTLFPLDTYVDKPVTLMEVVPGDKVETPIWDIYKEIIAKHDERGGDVVGNVERFAFYGEAKSAYAIIATSEEAIYANIMLQKGVVK